MLWNDDFGVNGAWDPSSCRVVETDAEKTTCACEKFGMMTVVLEETESIEIDDDCPIQIIVKYVGIAFTVILALGFTLVTIGSKYVWDMFHVIRIHVLLTWMAAVLFHIGTDITDVRDDADLNLTIGFFMKYFYTSSCIWMAMEAHAHFKVSSTKTKEVSSCF